MNKILLLFSLIQAIVYGQESKQRADMSFYHSTPQIYKNIEGLSSNCPHMQEKKLSPEIDVRLYKFSKGQNANKKKAFFLFGEHPREMISSETGYNLVNTLCYQNSDKFKKSEVDQILNDYEIQIIVNANPISRQQVESGKYCLRLNENGVDINRNYDSHWKEVNDMKHQTNSGPKAFSEVQTQLISAAVAKQKPDLFLTVHSGALGIFTPYAYEQKDPERNKKNMNEVLSEVNKKYCAGDCDSGPVAASIGYLSPGTSLDWVYDELQVPYSYAWEIYRDGIELQGDQDTYDVAEIKNKQKKEKEASNAAGAKKNLRGQSYSDIMDKMKDQNNKVSLQPSFAEIRSKSQQAFPEEVLMDPQDQYEKCFGFFNPTTKDSYQYFTNNWTGAILLTMQEVSKRINGEKSI